MSVVKEVVEEIKNPEEPVVFRFSSDICYKQIQVLSNGKEIKKAIGN